MLEPSIVLYRQRPPYIIWWAIGVHLVWGAALMVNEQIARVAILVGLNKIIELGIPGSVMGGVLIAAALLAAYGLLRYPAGGTRTSLLLLLPQYALLISALFSDIHAVIVGQADSVVDRLLLFTVLWPIMLAALLHSAAILERHGWTRS